jgi:nucleoid DNA-binding protein
MDQYIQELLLLHSKIILPKFGAIVIANEETGELSFNEYLSYDDGKLSNKLKSESNMDLQEAQNTVAKFVRELKLQLNKGETYSIFQLGEFSKDKDGSFIFEGNIKAGGKAESDNSSKPTPTPTVVVPPKKVERETPVKKEEPKEPVKKVVVVADSTPKEKATDNSEVKKNVYIEKNTDVKPTPIPTPKNEPQTIIVEKKRRKGFLFWFLLFLVLLIITGTTLVIMNQDKVEEYMGWTMFDKNKSDKDALKEKPVEVKEKVETAIVPEEEITPDEETVMVEEPVKENITPVTPSTGQHHIVVGCFGEKKYADKMVSDFKQKGFDSKIISQLGGLYFVAAQSYPTFQAANSDLSRVRQEVQGAWLYKN